ncbi:MAG: TetR/AcrR family transcriptional regulator [Spirochaetia bacterium]|nr:TetR/AcrR family transcriptional regulator [Spirochaetia bacterium]
MHKFGKKENNQREDRRIRRTKNLLKQAMIELILEKEYEDISVQSIIDRADVGRTSFYAHFRSKEDLLLQNLDDIENIFKPEDDKEHDQNINDFSLMIFRHIEENWKLARLLLGNPKMPVVRNHVQAILLKYYKNQLQIAFDKKKTTIEIEGAAVVFSAALLSLILWWLSMKKPVSHDIMHELFLKHIRNI